MASGMMTRSEVVGFVSEQVELMEQRVAAAIAMAVKMAARQMAGTTGTTVGYGRVLSPGPPVAVELDIDGSVISSYALGGVVVDQRVAVLYTPPSGSLVLGAPNIGVGSGMINAALQGWAVFVDEHGAIGDGDADDTGPIYEAASVVPGPGGLLIYGAGKTYNVPGGLAFLDKPIMHMGSWGQGQLYSSGEFSRAATRITSAVDGDIFLIGDADKTSIEGQFGGIMNMAIMGSADDNSVGPPNQVGLAIDNRGATIQNVDVVQCGSDGFQIRDNVSGMIVNSRSYRNGRHGFLLDPSLGGTVGPAAVTNMTMLNITALGNKGTGMRLHSGTWGCIMYGGSLQENENWAVYLEGIAVSAGTRFNRFHDVWEEHNLRTITGCSTTTGVTTIATTTSTFDDIGKTVVGPNIPLGARIGNVLPGVNIEVVPAPTTTATVDITLGGPIRFNDPNTSDNDADFVRMGSGLPSYSDHYRRNLVSGSNISDLGQPGVAQRRYHQIMDIVTAGPYDSSDIDALRIIGFDQDIDGVVRMERLICTYQVPQSGAGVTTTSMPVPTNYAINVASGRGIGAMRADPNDGPYELLASGSDDSVQIGGTNFPGQVCRIWPQVDMQYAKGMIWPVMTTAERDALTGVIPAMGIFNSTAGKYQGRMPDNTWQDFVMTASAPPPPTGLYPSDTQYPADTLYPNG